MDRRCGLDGGERSGVGQMLDAAGFVFCGLFGLVDAGPFCLLGN